jgi:hypothetical protein
MGRDAVRGSGRRLESGPQGHAQTGALSDRLIGFGSYWFHRADFVSGDLPFAGLGSGIFYPVTLVVNDSRQVVSRLVV